MGVTYCALLALSTWDSWLSNEFAGSSSCRSWELWELRIGHVIPVFPRGCFYLIFIIFQCRFSNQCCSNLCVQLTAGNQFCADQVQQQSQPGGTTTPPQASRPTTTVTQQQQCLVIGSKVRIEPVSCYDLFLLIWTLYSPIALVLRPRGML